MFRELTAMVRLAVQGTLLGVRGQYQQFRSYFNRLTTVYERNPLISNEKDVEIRQRCRE